VEGEKLQERIGPDEARKLIATPGQAQVLDLRPQDDFGEGHIPGASNVDPDELDIVIGDLSREEPVIVVCQEGKRSAEVAERLRNEGFDSASIKGGMSSWVGEKLPVQPTEDEEYEGPRRPGPLGQ
jgi:rhodanese-related sulfurtransferase